MRQLHVGARPLVVPEVTWGEFKELVYEQGVLDTDEIDWIDIDRWPQIDATIETREDGTRHVWIS